jgi:hypothetical protein
MKVVTKGIVMPLFENLQCEEQVEECERENKTQEPVKKRKRGRPRKNIKFRPLVSSRSLVFEEEAEEDIEDGPYLGKREPAPQAEEIEGEGGKEQSDGSEEEWE